MVDWQSETSDPKEFMETLRVDLFEDEVYVFTPKGEVKSLAAGATPLDFAYEVHTDVGHRCVGAKVNGKIVPLSYELRSGDIVEVLTSKRERGPSRDWLAVVKTSRARNKIKQWFKAENRQDTEHSGREALQEALRKQGLPAQRITGSALLADVIRELGFRKADDFYIALGAREDLAEDRGREDPAAPQAGRGRRRRADRRRDADDSSRPRAPAPDQLLERVRDPRRGRRRRDAAAGEVLPSGARRRHRRLHLARPRDHDPPRGLLERAALQRDPDRFTQVAWEGGQTTGFKVEIQIDGWDRHRLLEDLSRTFSEAGMNIVEAQCPRTRR